MRQERKHYVLIVLFTVIAFGLSFGSKKVNAETNNIFTYDVTEENKVCITNVDKNSNSVNLEIPETIDGMSVIEISKSGLFDILDSYETVSLPSGLNSASWTEACHWSDGNNIVLKEITVSNNNANYSTENGILYNKDKTELIFCPPAHANTSLILPQSVKVIDSEAFYNNSNLEYLTLPDGLSKISESAFVYCKNLKTVDIPVGMESIESEAFYECNSLRIIRIPDSVKLGEYDKYFRFLPEQTTVYCNANSEIAKYANLIELPTAAYEEYESDLTKAKSGGLYKYKELSNGTIEITSYIGWEKNLDIPSTVDNHKVSRIGDKAFYYDYNLVNVSIPEGITYIGKRAFSDCIKLEKVTLPDGLDTIDDHAFYFCLKLNNIVIPESVRHFGDYAFAECNVLSSINIPEGVTDLAKCLFVCCYKMQDVSLPSTLKTINEYAFYGCNYLYNITIPEGVTSIEQYAFYYAFFGDGKEKKLDIPKSVTSIGDCAFVQCRYLSDLTINNANCYIADNENTIYNKTIIHGYNNSTAYNYAKKYARQFVALDGNKTPGGSTNNNTTTQPPSANNPSSNGNAPSTNNPPVSTGQSSQTGNMPNMSNVSIVGTILTDRSSKASYTVTSANGTVAYKGTTNKKAKSVSIPATVTSGGVTYKVTSIAASALKNNKTITKVTIGSNITSIGKQAFSGCKKLKTITIKTKNLTAKSIGSKAFAKAGSNDYKKLTVKVPKSRKVLYKKILKKKGLSEKVKIK